MPQINVRWADNTEQLRRNLKEGVNQIEATKASVERLVKALAGENLIAAANKWTAAIAQMGGVSKIASADAVRAFGTISKAIETLERQGKTVPDDMRRLAKELSEVAKPASALNKWLGDLTGQITATAAGFISAQAIMGAAGTAWRTFTGFIADSVKAYTAAEASAKKLTTALSAQGFATPAVIGQYKALGDQFQKTTAFSDDLIVEMEALLVQIGNVMPSQMERALDAATNLAAGLGIDLETATTLVAKAAAGHTETLGRYGIQVDAAAVKTKGLDAVLESINKQFGGQASAQLDTYAGRVQQMANNWDNLKEAIGRVIISSPLTEAALRALNTGVSGLESGATGANHSISTLVRSLGLPISPAFIAFLESWADSANKAAEAQDRLNKLRSSVKPVASHETETERQEKSAREAAAARERQKKADEEARKAAEAYAKSLEEVNKKIREALAPTSDLSAAQQVQILNYRNLGLTNEEIALKMRLTTKTVDEFTTATDNARRAVQGLKETALSGPIPGLRLYDAHDDVAALQQFIDKLREIESGTFRPKTDTALLTGPLPGWPLEKPDFEKDTEDVNKLQRSLSAVEEVLGGINTEWANMAVVAARTISVISERLSEGDWVGAITAGVAGGVQLLQGLFRDEEWERVNDLRDAWFDQAGGLTAVNQAAMEAAGSIAAVQKLLDAKTVDAYNEALKELEAILERQARIESEAESRFGPSSTTLRERAEEAQAIFEWMRDAGTFTAEQLDKAYVAWQQAMADAGDAAAQAWIAARKEAEKAVAAGTDQFKKAEKGLEDLIAKRDSLAAGIAKEAPEEVMGVIETQQRAELAVLDQEIQRKADEYAALAKSTGQQMADAITEALKRINITLTVGYDLVPTGSAPTIAPSTGPSRSPKPAGSYEDFVRDYWAPDRDSVLASFAATGGIVEPWGIQHFRIGGLVQPRGTDTVPAMLTPGEMVLTKAQQAAVFGSGEVKVGSIVVHQHVTENVDADALEDNLIHVLRTRARVYQAVGTIAQRAMA